ncbi:Ectonucleotide pyrophosphatase/phosphodiesterase family member 4 [Gryllus bimaculatus]|nr:Ectonucleotide pyrophosphatase/phosphodiesterase family member 4 [Gryllus bimaculatus]
MIYQLPKKLIAMTIIRIDAFVFLLLLPCLDCTSQTIPRALVISFDGFRYNYPNLSITPTLEEIRMEGTHAEFMYNVFETKTFPNHHSIATGLYPDFHGVIANSFYDPHYDKVLKYSQEMWEFSDQILPIWIHNEDHGSERHSGVYMWPGSNYKYRNKYPTHVEPFNSSTPWHERVDTVVNWFLDPDSPANFVMMYFEEPDAHSHKFGPDSEEVKEQIKKIDRTVSYLRQCLYQKNLTDTVNVIFLSDHGMAAVPPQNLINVTDLLKSYGDHCIVAGTSPVLHIIPKTNIEEEVYTALKKLSESNQFAVYRKNELPPEWLYAHNRRIPPIMIVANNGYAFDDIRVNGTKMYGVHGYDNRLTDMHPFFMAYGPNIKKNYTIEPFNSVDLFSLFCAVLNLQMVSTNGTVDHVKEMLVPAEFPMSSVAITMASLFILLMGCLAAVLIKNLYTQYLLRRYDSSNGFSVSKEFENIHLLDSDDME